MSTDLASGTVTFTAQHAGDFFLSYTDAYGAAPTANGTIRVHVIPASGNPKPPVTTPDVAVLHGQQPAIVDVLADDYDPQGWILGVTSATSVRPGVQVAVVDQQWLRISADDPQPGMTATVDYTVSDGKGSATGTVAVSAVPADPGADQITTTEAAITVQAGDSAAVPVLAGDASSTGLPLSARRATPPTVSAAGGRAARVSVQGSDIRIDAPAAVKSEEETAVSYVATDADGTTATGQLDVTIEPAPSKADPDQAPVPQEVDAQGDGRGRRGHPDPGLRRRPGRRLGHGHRRDGAADARPDRRGRPGLDLLPVLPGLGRHGHVHLPGHRPVRADRDRPGADRRAAARAAAAAGRGRRRDQRAARRVAALERARQRLHRPRRHRDRRAAEQDQQTVAAGVRLTGSYVYLQVPSSPSDPPVQFTYGAHRRLHPVARPGHRARRQGAQIPPIANDAVAPRPAARREHASR